MIEFAGRIAEQVTLAVGADPDRVAWAIDLAKGGPLDSKAMNGRSVPVVRIPNQNLKSGAAFDSTIRYAFGFDLIVATNSAHNVNLDADGLTLYSEMRDAGYAAYFVGTATRGVADLHASAKAAT